MKEKSTVCPYACAAKKGKTKSRCFCNGLLVCLCKLDSAGYFAGTQATGAGVDPFGGTGHHRLDALDIGLPGTVGAAMGMGNLNAERHALTANIAFCQLLHLLVGQ